MRPLAAPLEALPVVVAPPPGRLAGACRTLAADPMTLLASGLFAVLTLVAATGKQLAPYPPLASNTDAALAAPSALHWFGTDQLGRDIFTKIKTELWQVSKVERDNKMEGKRMILVLQPDHKTDKAPPPVNTGRAPATVSRPAVSGTSMNIQAPRPVPAAAPAPQPAPAGSQS